MGTDHPALAGLDDVAWHALAHAFGPATDVPELLRELAGTRPQQEHALAELAGTIWHQGTIYEATVHAVPFLARLVLAEPPPLRDEVLDLLAYIATGTSYLDVHGEALSHIRGEPLSDDERAGLGAELEHVRAARAAVLAAAMPMVTAVLAQPTPLGLALVARLAAAYPDEAEPFTAPLDQIWESAEDIRLRAAVAIALSRRGADGRFVDDFLSDVAYDLHGDPETE